MRKRKEPQSFGTAGAKAVAVNQAPPAAPAAAVPPRQDPRVGNVELRECAYCAQRVSVIVAATFQVTDDFISGARLCATCLRRFAAKIDYGTKLPHEQEGGAE